MKTIVLSVLLLGPSAASADQEPQAQLASGHRLMVTVKDAKAMDYHGLRGAVRIDLNGTALLPDAFGEAKVKNKNGLFSVSARFDHLQPAAAFGSGYLTYVLWAISPEGQANNLGEVRTRDSEGAINATTSLPVFSLVLTAEPNFAVSQPSELLVLQNAPTAPSRKVQSVDAKYEMLPREPSGVEINPSGAPTIDAKTPLDIQEARLALKRARLSKAPEYAADSFNKASELLRQAEEAKKVKRATLDLARAATQEAESARAVAIKAKGDSQKLAMQTEADKTRQEAQEAQHMWQQAEKEKEEMRDALSQQLNAIAHTMSTPRGLILTMSDVFFEFGKADLQAGAREKLAKIGGIMAAHPDLKMTVEGYTDSIGSDDYNMRLSENRAKAVRDSLMEQGIPADSITARGFGKTRPVASNDAPAGRQQNRRVEIVVSGEGIGQSGR